MFKRLIDDISQNFNNFFVEIIIGLLIAFIFYRLGRKVKEPKYYIENNTIIEGFDACLEGIEIIFKGVPQSRITKSLVFFWNAGKETINRSDLLPVDPLRILVPSNIRILDACVLKASNLSNEFTTQRREGENSECEYVLDFHYLDFEEGGVIQLIHTGDKRTNFQLKGKIKGARQISLTIPIVRIWEGRLPYLLKVLMGSRVFIWSLVIWNFFLGLLALIEPFFNDIAWHVALMAPYSFLASLILYFFLIASRIPPNLTENVMKS